MYIEIIIKWDDKLWNKKLDVDLSRTISTYVNNIVRVVYVYMAIAQVQFLNSFAACERIAGLL